MKHRFNFLSIEEIININADQCLLFGGRHGIRDHRLLDSAVNRPQALYQGSYLYKTVFEMAAAYAHGIIKNHPFVDGNKRTGIISALLFLELNNCSVEFSNKELVELGVDIATSKLSLEAIAKIFAAHKL